MNLSLQGLQQMRHTAADSPFCRIAPLPKVCFVLGFLLLTVSFGHYSLAGAVLFALTPFLLAVRGGVPAGTLFRRALTALPFVLCAGIANLFFDRLPVSFYGLAVPGGLLSLLVLTAKTLASVGMVLLLAATTSMQDIAGSLTRLHVPCLLILVLQLLYRYLFLLAEEAVNLRNAYFLRNPGCRVIPVREWGVLTGRLFIKSVERADAVYAAMQCRLFRAGAPLRAGRQGSRSEWAGFGLLFGVFCFLRIVL